MADKAQTWVYTEDYVAESDAHTVVAREVVNYLRDSEEFVPALLPVGDGLAVAVKR